MYIKAKKQTNTHISMIPLKYVFSGLMRAAECKQRIKKNNKRFIEYIYFF